MQIEYQKLEGISAWAATLNGKQIGRIVVQNFTNGHYCEEGKNEVFASDHTLSEPELIPGSPFESVNKAKAVLEYHFRHLTK